MRGHVRLQQVGKLVRYRVQDRTSFVRGGQALSLGATVPPAAPECPTTRGRAATIRSSYGCFRSRIHVPRRLEATRASSQPALTGRSGHTAVRLRKGTVGCMSIRARLQGPLRMVFQAEPPVADAKCPTVVRQDPQRRASPHRSARPPPRSGRNPAYRRASAIPVRNGVRFSTWTTRILRFGVAAGLPSLHPASPATPTPT